jgi:hypothetical protein
MKEEKQPVLSSTQLKSPGQRLRLGLYQRTFAIREQVMGALHLSTTTTRTAYLLLLRTMDQEEKTACIDRAPSEEEGSSTKN